jgi:arylsulfatase A-like enzyme
MRPWIGRWALITVLASSAATALDAVLLQYQRSYFTGGFLASDYITRPSEAFAFFAGSLLTDAAVIGVIAAMLLWFFGRLGIPRNLAVIATLVLAVIPVIVTDFVEYELLTYLGDAFDFRLLFDLSGRNLGEIIAVSSAHLTGIVSLVAGTIAVGAAALYFIVRRGRAQTAMLERLPSWRCLIAPAALLLVGVVIVTLLRSGSDVLDNGLRRKPTGQWLGSVVVMLTDVDRDGYGILGRPPDPNLFDAHVQPYALDIPGNGIDEDGVGGDLPATVDAYHEGPSHPSTWQSTQDVILIVLESFRADARGATLQGKPVTPVLDELAAKGIAPTLAYSHNGYTVQSRHHIFSGSTAGIRDGTLIDDFKRHGYQVAYFSAQDESFGGPQDGVGFERADVAYDARADRDLRFTQFSTPGSLAVPLDVVERRVETFLDRRRPNQPLFLYINFQDTHFPYHHRGIQPLVSSTVVAESDITPEHADAVRAMYLNTASNVDHAIGEILEHTRRALEREPGIIVLSDHGESLFDEGFLGHGYALNDAQTRIPLVVANLPMTIDEPFVQADLRDAIAEALGRPYVDNAKPTIRENPSRAVFQYLGQITRPAQIAFTGSFGRTMYDFREGRARVGNGAWRRPEDLPAAEHAAFLSLVQTWERMMLARHAANEHASTE